MSEEARTFVDKNEKQPDKFIKISEDFVNDVYSEIFHNPATGRYDFKPLVFTEDKTGKKFHKVFDQKEKTVEVLYLESGN